MMQKIKWMIYLAPLVLANQASAQGISIDFPTQFAGFSSQELKTTIQNIVRLILGFLGIVTIIIILYGGFVWLSAFGDDDKVGKAKKLIASGVIGLVVVLASYAISNFVINSLQNAF